MLFEYQKEHIRIISEGSWDTEDRNNGWWKFSFVGTGIKYIKKYIKTENCYLKLQYYLK